MNERPRAADTTFVINRVRFFAELQDQISNDYKKNNVNNVGEYTYARKGQYHRLTSQWQVAAQEQNN